VDLKRCPICNTILEKRTDSYYCSVCDLVIPRELEKEVFIFGIAKECKEDSNIIVNRLDSYCIMIPQRGRRITMVKSFQYFKTLMKKLKDVATDYICADIQAHSIRELPFPAINSVETELLLGVEPIAIYKIRESYIIIGHRVVRVCSRKAKYKELYGLLLVLSSNYSKK